MRNLLWKLLMVLVVLGLFAWSTYPPETQLRLGKDLRGGATLIYSVQIAPGENASDILNKTIDVLKERVDPEGLLEISMVPVGRDRIEITMPLPNDKVKELRVAYEEELEQLEATAITPDEFELMMRLPPPERAGEIENRSDGNQALADLMTAAADAYDAAEEARGAVEQAVAAGEPEDAVDDARLASAQAAIDYEAARDAVLNSVVSPEEVARVLRLSDRERYMIDRETGQAVTIESPRARAWSSLLETAPAQTDQLEKILEAYTIYESERTTLDDPNDLVRLLRGAGVLTFRITVDPNTRPDEQELREKLRELGPQNAGASDAKWYKVNRIENWTNSVQDLEAVQQFPAEYFRDRGFVAEEYDGEYFMLAWDTKADRLTPQEGQWAVDSAFQGVDQLGRPAINFVMDATGASLLGRLTENHVGDQMAVLLDDQVYTAPNLRGRIARSGQIEGDFDPEELQYVIRVLSAGSLQAKLSPAPISQSTVGPRLGLDNLQSGLKAGVIALVAVSIFMLFYYFIYGSVAVIALGCNAVIILGAMALNRAAFTLPGIAGVILTFGMAVDANVLIYERIREELRKGIELRPAVRLGYSKALSSIVDANVTNLIVCVVLAYTGTQEIKGFAITLGIGVVATLFSALVVARLVFDVLLNVVKVRKMRMLPMAIPSLERLLEPKIKWLSLRWGFLVISLCYVGLGVAMIAYQGKEMLGTEFRGGIKVQIPFSDQQGDPVYLTRTDVLDRVRALAEGKDTTSPLAALRDAEVLPRNPEPDGVSSDEFEIQVMTDNYASSEQAQEQILDALETEFAPLMSSLPQLTFQGSTSQDPPSGTVFPVLAGESLGDVIGRPEYRNDIRSFSGGVAIVIDDISPPRPVEELDERLNSMREQPDFSDTLAREWESIPLETDADGNVTTAVVLVRAPSISFYDSPDSWKIDLADREWDLTRSAFADSASPMSADTFSSAIAATFKAQAIVAVILSLLLIMIYIWVRFGSARYSIAAIVTLAHDVMTAIGLIALAEILYELPATQGFVQSIGIRPFKIDLNLVAAILTIIGYSLNDTIIIMDRIRENRGKLPYATDKIVNDSINQTISRTVITSGTTFIAVLILYIFGGEGVRAFAYALMVGVVIGTYSSIAVAAPMVWSRKRDKVHQEPDAERAESMEAAPAGVS